MPTSYPLTLPFVRVSIAGVDRTDEVLARTLVVHQVLGAQVDTANFTIKPKETWRGSAGSQPQLGQAVTIEHKTGANGTWTVVFGGQIQRVNEHRVGYKAVSWDVQCSDYTDLLKRVLVDATFVDQPVGAIVREVIQRYAPFVSTSGIQNPQLTIGAITFSNQYPADVLQRLAQMTGYEWWVSADKVLYFVDPDTHTQVNVNPVTDTSENFNRLTLEPQQEQVRNRVRVMSDQILSDESLEEFDADDRQWWFDLKHKNVIADFDHFMMVNGAVQRVMVQGATDAATFTNNGTLPGWVLDAANGRVSALTGTPALTQGDHVVFLYRYRYPGAVVREDAASQRMMAIAEGVTYSGVVLADAPLYYWRLNEQTGMTAANLGTAGVSASGMWVGSREVVPGPLPGDQGVAVRLPGGTTRANYLRGSRAVVMPSGSYTIEALVDSYSRINVEGGAGLPILGGIAGLFNYDTNRGASLYMVAPTAGEPNQYVVNHGAITVESGMVAGAAWEHLVATYDAAAQAHKFYRNKQLISSTAPGVPGYTGVSGIYIGSEPPGNPNNPSVVDLNGLLAEVAIYGTALSPERVAVHYDAGRYGGVREVVITDNQLQTYEHLDLAAERELLRYGMPLTSMAFSSTVPGWTVGERLYTVLTAAGTGRTFSGMPLVQQVDWRWIGAQQVEYSVRAIGTRLNLVDYFQQLQRLRQIQQTAVVSRTAVYEGTVVLVGATPDITSI